jgi:GTP-binding protein
MLGNRLILADLPGYGYARVSKADSQRWTELIFAYLRGRPNLLRVILLIDSRRGVLSNDDEVMDLLDKAAVSYQLVLTKGDKLKPAALAKVEEETLKASLHHGAAYPSIAVTSSLEGLGIADLRASLAAFA